MKSTKIIIQSAPTQVTYTCPHCEKEIKIDYNDFESDMTSECWCDWDYQIIECPNCGKTNIIIDDDGSEYATEEFLVCDSCEDTFDDIYRYIDAVRSYDSLIWSYLVEVETYFADVDINSYKWQNTCRKLIIEELQR